MVDDQVDEEIQIWPMRTTAARSLRVGDELRIPTGHRPSMNSVVRS